MLMDIWEHRTTVSCCSRGQPTAPLMVMEGTRRRPSRRLRVCTSCDNTHGSEHPVADHLQVLRRGAALVHDEVSRH